MRKFVRTFFVKRRAQVTVFQDASAREFEIYRWRATDRTLARLAVIPYQLSDVGAARARALAQAKAAAEDETRGTDAVVVSTDLATDPRRI